MFISRKEWEKLQERINELEQQEQLIECVEVKGETKWFTDSFAFAFGNVKRIPINKAICLILNYFDLKLEKTPAKMELVKKDDK